MIEAKNFTKNDIRRAYNVRSWFYKISIKKAQDIHSSFAIIKAELRARESILECGVGPGDTFLELAEKTGKKPRFTEWIYQVKCFR
jgi:cyclopropane fatty-acyl-phospholipid synthase-like methyltransferase